MPMKKGGTIPKKKIMVRWAFGFMVALLAMPLPEAAAAADVYPSKAVRLIISFAPGGSTDIVGRMIAAKLSERLGKQVIAQNQGGGGGTLGMEMVAKSEPDGYTLLFTSSAIAINPLLYKVPYDPVKSFIPIAKVGNGPAVLTVHPSVPVNSVQELVALAKKQPGKMICAASGAGSFVHLSSELFRMMAGIDFKIVQFKGGGPAMIDVMGGHSQILVGSLTMSLPQMRTGKLKALGYGGATRTKLVPDLPTISEAGVPGYEAAIWWGFFAPAGTPKEIIDRLYREIAAIMNSEEMRKTFDEQGSDVEVLASAEFAKFVEAETVKWGKVIKAGNIQGE
jgi:tripartite-type tricarboxylate transporter receptor subunit TctC